MNNIIVFSCFLAIGILVIGNSIILYRLKKQANTNVTELPDSKYFELKYRLELIIAMFSLLVGIFGFIGFNTYNDLKNNYETAIGETRILDSALKDIENSLGIARGDLKGIGKSSINLGNKLSLIKAEMDSLSKKYYVIKPFFYKLHDLSQDTIIYFKNLATIEGSKLPQFSKPPIIFLNLGDGVNDVIVYRITKESFHVKADAWRSGDIYDVKFDLVIID